MQAATNKTNNKQSDIAQLLSRYIPYWPYFLGSLIICGIFAQLYLHFKTPVFQISASILIKSDDKSNNESFLPALDLFSSKKIVENETEILHSHTLMDEVVKKIGLYAPIYIHGTVHDRSGYTGSPIRIQLKYPDRIEVTNKTEKTYFTYDGKNVFISGKKFLLNKWMPWHFREIKFIPNPQYVIAPPIEKDRMFFLLLNVKQVASGLIGNLDIAPSGKLSTVINLTLKDQVPQRGKDILNELITFYNVASLKDKNKLASNAVHFLDERLNYVARSLDSIEVALQLYKADKGGVDLSEQSRLILGSVAENDEKKSEINVQLAALNQIESYVKENNGSPGIIPSSSNENDVVLSQYLGNLYNAELQYDRLQQTTAQNNPMLLTLKNQIDKIKPTILQYIRNKINTLTAAKTNLNATAGQYSSMLRTIPQKQRDLLEISRQQSIKNNLYDFLLKRKEEAALSYAASVSNTRIVDQAVVQGAPVSPKRNLVYGIAFILGLIIPVSFVSINKKIISKAEIKEMIHYPFLGEIANSTSKKSLLIANDKKNFIAEQFRQIRTSLNPALGIKTFKNKILITSAISGEGKSFIASNLSLNLAMTGKKVLLIDMDLHKPDQNNVFNEKRVPGLVDFLLGDTGIEDIIYQTNAHRNLQLIPSGKSCPEPSELILSEKFPLLLAYLEEIYDCILMDTAPVNLITDGYVISQYCDASILVIRYGITTKSEITALKDNIPSRELKNPGIIFNGVKSFRLKSSGIKYYGYIKKRRDKEEASFVQGHIPHENRL